MTIAAREPGSRSVEAAVSVETDVGSILLPRDEVMLPWIQHYRCWEPEVASCLRSLLAPGMTFVDIGAHVGYHTLLASQVVGPSGRIVALEPEPNNFALLVANLKTHAAVNVQPVASAAWSETGYVDLEVSQQNSGDHRVYRRVRPSGIRVPSLALDELLAFEPVVHVVKSDVQGTDHLAIRGMEATIARCQPFILAEFWPVGIIALGDDPIHVLDYYRSLGFGLALLESPSIPSDAAATLFVSAAEALAGGFGTLILRPLRRGATH